MFDMVRHPWPWYVVGPLIGLVVPTLLLMGNRSFGVSANLRHICASCFPANISFFKYDWRKESWNLFFAAGIFIGAFIAAHWFADPNPVVVDPRLQVELQQYKIIDHSQMLPAELFSVSGLSSLRGLIMLIGGGFLVGFGTRYAGGCTSGHAIMGLSTLQWPSLVATISFMAGGFIMANLILPFILKL